jgi:2-polyprenyl-6-methoxyphenol hydroxylase-like FAD-dependent oxidoreductase
MDRAVVLGGGMAGLLAARVLADHAKDVIIVESDDFAGGPVARRGVPQGNQVHGLLARGLELMESLFPGLTAELADAGAEVVDPPSATRPACGATSTAAGACPRAWWRWATRWHRSTRCTARG